ncbi:major facilitator superfamily domain-containing protein [Melampsora americana]|nr:major facilitator superfamily domain-containing protein [Melampsora americana]
MSDPTVSTPVTPQPETRPISGDSNTIEVGVPQTPQTPNSPHDRNVITPERLAAEERELFLNQSFNSPVLKTKLETDEKEDELVDPVDTVVPKSTILAGKRLALAFVGMLLSVLLISLDQTILSPALPTIASNFHALDQIGWIASAYLITQVSFLLLYAQLLVTYNRRWVFIVAIMIFELGSLICALSPNVIALIVGRAVSGMGAAGIFISCLSIIADITELQDRPKLLGSFGAVFAAASVIGPLLGGALTDHLSWRWCFWINLPCGAITIFSIFLVIPNTPARPLSGKLVELVDRRWNSITFGKWIPAHDSVLHKLGSLDIVGAFLMVGLIILLVLPLQWGGNKYPWKSGVIIGTFCGFGVMLGAFLLWEWKGVDARNGRGLLSFKLLRNRTQVGACLQAFFIKLSMLSVVYFLPIYFQVIQHASATKSGIDLLPLMLTIVVSAAAIGFLISHTGYYWPALIVGSVILTVGTGLLYTLDEFSSNAKISGFQVMVGAGLGLVLQNVVVAIQANVEDEDIPQATSLSSFAQLIGGVIGIAVAQTIFGNALSENLQKYAPEAPAALIRSSIQSIAQLSDSVKPGVIHSYTLALRQVYILGIVCGVASFFSAFLVTNKNIKKDKEQSKNQAHEMCV